MRMSIGRTRQHILLISLCCAVAGYLLPWVVAPSAPMTLGAYDLAEWVSLHPSQHHTSPPLQAPLLLRLQLVVFSLLLGIARAGKPRRLAAALIIISLAIGQLPPPEYLRDLGNVNYRQQFILAATSLTLGLALLHIRHARFVNILAAVLPLAGAVSALHGVAQAFDVYSSLNAGGTIGLGLWILVASYVGCFALVVIGGLQRRPNRL